MSDDKDIQFEDYSPIREIEGGIFNLVISLCQQLSLYNDKEVAQEYVANYLERLALGLKEQKGNTE